MIDYDGDGDDDLFFTATQGGCRLFQNDELVKLVQEENFVGRSSYKKILPSTCYNRVAVCLTIIQHRPHLA